MSHDTTRRAFLKTLGMGGAVVGASAIAGPLLTACGSATKTTGSSKGAIKVGVLTDLTGAFGIVGKSNKAIAEFTIDEINAAGGVLGRKLQMVLVDSATDPATGASVARQLISQDKVDVVIGGVASNMREAIKSIIAERGKTIYIWPASYEGGECDKYVWNTGSVPNQQVDPTVRHLLDGGAKSFFLCGNDYVYPRSILAQVKKAVQAGGGKVVGEEYIPLSTTDPSVLTSKVLASNADALFEVVVLPATAPFIKGVVDGGFKGKIAGTLFDEGVNSLIGKQAQGLICVQDYYAQVTDSFSKQKVAEFHGKYPDQIFASTFNSAGWYRGLYLWKTAVEKAGSLDLAAVEKAMDTASYDQLIGGPASFKPGTRHCSLTMYLGEMQADGSSKVIKDLGKLDPEQCG